jgi:hypothetical protein
MQIKRCGMMLRNDAQDLEYLMQIYTYKKLIIEQITGFDIQYDPSFPH